MNQKNFSISEIHWSHIFNEFLMSVTPRREENAVFLETGSNSVMLFSIALCAFGVFVGLLFLRICSSFLGLIAQSVSFFLI